jgi:hypothetical protein
MNHARCPGSDTATDLRARWQVPDIAYGLTDEVSYVSHVADNRRRETTKGLIQMTARKTPAKATTTAPVKLSGEMVEAPPEALANEAAAAASIAQDVQAPADEVTDAIAELDEKTPKAAPKKAPAKKATAQPAPKEAVRTSHTDCTHAKTGRDGKAARAACRRERAAAEVKATTPA